MHFNIISFLIAAIMAVTLTLANGPTVLTILTGKVGESLCLIPNLHGFSQLILSAGSDHHVLLNIFDGKVVKNESERFQLDKSGSLIISPLNRNDSGEYGLTITSKNYTEHHYTYRINVTEPDPTQTPAGISDDNTGDQNHPSLGLTVGLPVGLAVAAVVLGLIVYVMKKKGIRCDPVCGDNGVV